MFPSSPCFKYRVIEGETLFSNWYFFKTFQASWKVEESGTKGPDPMVSSWSPMTSERIRLITVAGKASLASWPPLVRERCFRTVLISWIGVPALSRSWVTFCFSIKEIDFGGRGNKAEQPPEV